MERKLIQSSVERGSLEWQRPSLERMFERGISRSQVKHTIMSGEVIEEYPDDTPYPSALYLSWFDAKPLHVVAAYDADADWIYVITAYIPDSEHFGPDYKTRR